MEKFHVEPKTWQELFEFTNFVTVDYSVKNLFREIKDVDK